MSFFLKKETAVGPVAGDFSRVKIFDTTLRDGEQSPGAALNHGQKIQIAKQLECLNVDVIEAGFPVASHGDFKAVEAVSKAVERPAVCALARALEKDIEKAWLAVKKAKNPRIHVFIATSPIHRKYKLGMSRTQILKQASEMVSFACSLCPNIEFSAEDASRTEPSFLFKVFESVIDSGAATINIPDTVGYSQPREFGALVKSVCESVSNIKSAAVSVHCHNDLGLAVANSLAAIENGASQIECTVNGLGERAGNAALEEIAMNLYTRKDVFRAKASLALGELYRTSKMVAALTGISVQKNKAIVGENAFSHEAGVHQQGLLANSKTYEIMDPALVGKETRLVLGKHSGKHATMAVMQRLGFSLSKEQAVKAVALVKALADRKKYVSRADLKKIALAVKKNEVIE